ncbi:MAG TPA: HAMP domain-containing sensor histidine kinase [Verrucomicrobiae bacterium]|nr:HAMP domain-containing sensor histidine kinase [Verrucomicrobiae bacterium]
MSSNPAENTEGRLSLRLNLWYSGFLILTSLALFVVAYVILAGSIQQREKELIRAKLDEYRAWYEGGGINSLSDRFFKLPESSRNAYFVRVVGRFKNALFLSVPDDWRDFDLKKIEVTSLDDPRPWRSLSSQNNTWLIASLPLSDGRLLQAGKSIEQSASILANFRLIFGVGLFVVVVAGYLGGAFLTHRALQPIRQLSSTVRGIIQTGRMDARVPVASNRDELDELVRLFNQMLAKNEGLIRSMREALDNVAHDLRTPMTRVRGVAEAALQTDTPDACREALADTLEESERVLTMLKTLMDISEAEIGAMRLELAEVNLRAAVGSVVELYEVIAEDKQITVTANIPEDLVIPADRARLQQVLANLVDNAIKYTPAGGRVELAANREGGHAIITVRDNGTGITAEEQPRIWERLYRGDKSRHEKGLGLGLSLVKAVVEAHGGSVDVASQPGAGATFTVRQPLEVLAGAKVNPQPEALPPAVPVP